MTSFSEFFFGAGSLIGLLSMVALGMGMMAAIGGLVQALDKFLSEEFPEAWPGIKSLAALIVIGGGVWCYFHRF